MTRIWSILLLLAALAFAASPWLASGFNGFEADQFPVPQNDPPVQPAGYAFAIWGLIYAWLIAGAGFGAVKRGDDPDWAAMRPPLFASLALGAFWLPLAQVSPGWATLLIWVMLGTALLSLFRVGDTDRWWQQAPVAIYAGWLTAASSVSIGLMLAGYGLLPETPAALIALSIGLAIALTVQYRLHRAPEYGITVIWALVGVIVANTGPINIAVVGLAVLGILAILALRGTDTE
ncbi:TspO/MBR family protein [Thalassococcus sp. BH17M4-6]|uniref:TspO/MBR family protein n=1 Tax=Thalassococcus sp. BH17M4-6 TaxID=3413148 RepID=UPI003BCB76BA